MQTQIFPHSRTRILEDQDINRLAPSVFATEAWHETSDKYRFIPTFQVLNALRDSGFHVTSARQSNSRIPGKKEFTKHMLRLRHRDSFNPLQVGEEIPEIVLINSHDRTSAWDFMLGMFRCVCSNQMIVHSSTIESFKIRHSGERGILDSVIDVSYKIIEESPKTLEQIKQFKSIELTQPEQLAFATASAQLLKTTMELNPARLLTLRRYADQGNQENGTNTLWKTSNIIQENLLRGGIRATNTKGRTQRTREVKCIQNNVSINKAIWTLTEELAKIKK